MTVNREVIAGTDVPGGIGPYSPGPGVDRETRCARL
jgi:hypothetical protein